MDSTLTFFTDWRKDIQKLNINKGCKEKMLPSKECMCNIQCLLMTFPEMCRLYLRNFPNVSIIPSRFNSDIVENVFCQQRGIFNGNNTNPNFATYCSTVNSIILGQSLKSSGRRSNAGIPSVKPSFFFICHMTEILKS